MDLDYHYAKNLLGFTREAVYEPQEKLKDNHGMISKRVVLGGFEKDRCRLNGMTGIVTRKHHLSKSYIIVLDNSRIVHAPFENIFLVFEVDQFVANLALLGEYDNDDSVFRKYKANIFAKNNANSESSSEDESSVDVGTDLNSDAYFRTIKMDQRVNSGDAVENGDADALNVLGAKYAEGVGFRRDNFEAFRLFQIAADRGDPQGQTNLGLMYAKGYGVQKSRGKSVRLFQLAAKQGYAPARLLLSTIQNEGMKTGPVELSLISKS